MEISQIQIKIDELKDWLDSNQGHHMQYQVKQNLETLENQRDQKIKELEVIEHEIINSK